MRRALFGLLLLCLHGCDDSWLAYQNLNADSCHNGGTQCQPGYVCDLAQRQCQVLRLPPPVLAAVTPAVADSRGGTEITLTGQDFQMGVALRIGGTAVADVIYDSPLQLRATLPASLQSYGPLQ